MYVRVMQLDAVVSRQARPARGGGKQCGQMLRQITNGRHMHVGHAFSSPHLQRFALARCQDSNQCLGVQRSQRAPHLDFRG